jgi:hypothetical protein
LQENFLAERLKERYFLENAALFLFFIKGKKMEIIELIKTAVGSELGFCLNGGS